MSFSYLLFICVIQFSPPVVSGTNDVKILLVKKRERHVLMRALGAVARIQAQSAISNGNDKQARD